MESDNMSFNANLGFINDIGEGGLQDTIAENLGSNDVNDHVSGWFASAALNYGSFSLIGEYLAAAESFQANEVPWNGQGAQPETWQVEAAYHFNLAKYENTIALGYQGSAEALAHGLPENRWLLGYSIGIFKNTSLGLEWAHDKDYGVEDGGTGETANTVTAQIAVEF